MAQGQALRIETDRSKQKDLITVYRNQKEEHYPPSLEQYFYCVFVDSAFTKNTWSQNHNSKTIETKSKIIRPNRLQFNSYVEPYRSLQVQWLDFLERVEIM